MTVRLHRCSNVWVKLSGHPCWKVQKALDEAGIDYEIVKGPLRPGKRDDVERLSGQRKYPVIEFEDGSVYREESKDMAAAIAAGQLESKAGAGGARRRPPDAQPCAEPARGPRVGSGVRALTWPGRVRPSH